MCKGGYDCSFHQLSMISSRGGALSNCLCKTGHDGILLVAAKVIQEYIFNSDAIQESVPTFSSASSLGFGVEDCCCVSGS